MRLQYIQEETDISEMSMVGSKKNSYLSDEAKPAIFKEKIVTLVNRRPVDFYLLRFYVTNRYDAEQICHHVISNRLATKAVFMDEVEKIRAKFDVLKDSK
jgi:hypothetical protein